MCKISGDSTGRECRARSIIFTTNIESGKWGTIFADDKLAAAIIDRIVHGYVVDMFDLQLFSYPVFNLADCCVVVGAILGGVYYLFLYEKYDKKKKEPDHAHDPSDPS